MRVHCVTLLLKCSQILFKKAGMEIVKAKSTLIFPNTLAGYGQFLQRLAHHIALWNGDSIQEVS